MLAISRRTFRSRISSPVRPLRARGAETFPTGGDYSPSDQL